MKENEDKELRILILADREPDIRAAADSLTAAGMDCRPCRSMDELESSVGEGAGTILVLLTALRDRSSFSRLADILDDQPVWSSLPVVAMTRREIADLAELTLLRDLERLSFVTFLEVPCGRATFVSTLRNALEARKRQYEVRRLMRKNEREIRLREEFLAMLGHEIRNPLAAVRSAVDLLGIEPVREDRVRRVRRSLERQTLHLTRIVSDLLDVSRVMRGKMRLSLGPVDLCAVARQAVAGMEDSMERARLALELRLPGEPVLLEGDEVRLTQVLNNLLDNAIANTDPGGRITVDVDRKEGGAELRVRDTGIGLTAESIDRIFELFSQVDTGRVPREGLGIGLTLSRRLVELHGGAIRASSEGPGTGSEFVVSLPAGGIPSAGPETGPGAVGGEAPPMRVLLVDDNVDLVEELDELLSEFGYRVRTAHTGAEAIRASEEFDPRVVLLDIGLPDMHGCDVAARIRGAAGAAGPHLVALTGYGSRLPDGRRLDDYFDATLVKPIPFEDLDRLLRSLAEAGGRSRTGGQPSG